MLNSPELPNFALNKAIATVSFNHLNKSDLRIIAFDNVIYNL